MPLAMTDQELLAFKEYIYGLSGIQLDASKKYLLETRLHDLQAELGGKGYGEILRLARADPRLERRVVDAVSTNETFFFRDRKYFDLVKFKLLPELFGDNTKRPLTIWSAASSTGQEAYSLSMVLKELLFDLAQVRVKILGTDISEAVVNAANKGDFTAFDLQRGLSESEISKYFVKVGDRFRVSDELRSICRFQTDNLLSTRPPFPGRCEIVLLRNVLIYFSEPDRKRVIERILKSMAPDGFLIVGAAEAILSTTDRLVREEFRGAVYYRLRS
ncbi:MAG TPA: protein-glutamate O-methyltransferase CheR [Polyangia bacterium]|jgi:chemotaxis protein methyltransferase CheR